MPDDENPRVPRRSLSVKIEKWGLVQAWLAGDPNRIVVFSCGHRGFQVTLVDPSVGEDIQFIEGEEDPSAAAFRGISHLASRKVSSSDP